MATHTLSLIHEGTILRREEGREGSTILKSLKSLSKEMSNLGRTLPEDDVSCLQPSLNVDQTFSPAEKSRTEEPTLFKFLLQ